MRVEERASGDVEEKRALEEEVVKSRREIEKLEEDVAAAEDMCDQADRHVQRLVKNVTAAEKQVEQLGGLRDRMEEEVRARPAPACDRPQIDLADLGRAAHTVAVRVEVSNGPPLSRGNCMHSRRGLAGRRLVAGLWRG